MGADAMRHTSAALVRALQTLACALVGLEAVALAGRANGLPELYWRTILFKVE